MLEQGGDKHCRRTFGTCFETFFNYLCALGKGRTGTFFAISRKVFWTCCEAGGLPVHIIYLKHIYMCAQSKVRTGTLFVCVVEFVMCPGHQRRGGTVAALRIPLNSFTQFRSLGEKRHIVAATRNSCT